MRRVPAGLVAAGLVAAGFLAPGPGAAGDDRADGPDDHDHPGPGHDDHDPSEADDDHDPARNVDDRCDDVDRDSLHDHRTGPGIDDPDGYRLGGRAAGTRPAGRRDRTPVATVARPVARGSRRPRPGGRSRWRKKRATGAKPEV